MNDEPVFLTVSEIIEIHRYQLENFGGSPGIRDLELLKSAVSMPSVTFGGLFLHPTFYEMAAAYLFHIVENHPFIDGNKRAGTMAALVFLDMNGLDFDAPPDELSTMVIRVASKQLFKPEVALFFRRYCTLRT